MWLISFVIIAQLLCGGWVVLAQSQITVSRPISHTLPQELESMFGSPVDGGCSSTSGTNNEICDGTSVLNDGILPALSGVSNDSQSQWAAQLFTMRRSGTDRIVLSFKFPISITSRNRLELVVFNCPQLGIYAPQVSVYVANTINADLTMITEMTISQVSCDHLWKFCVELGGAGVPNLNLVFPYQNNSDFVFIGEVTFLNDPINNECNAPELITMQETPQIPTIGPTTADTTDSTTSVDSQSSTSTTTLSQPVTSPSSAPIAIIAAVVVVVLVLMILLIVVLLVLTMFFMKRRRKQESNRVQQLQNVVMETEKEQNDGQRYVDMPNDYYSSVDKPPQNGVRLDVATGEVIITDTLYSNPDEVKNDTYSRLRDGEKRALTPVNSGTSDDQYSKLNRSQTDPGVMNSRPSPAPQKPADEGLVYAVPDKKKQLDNTPAIPEKSSELVEYLDIKEAQSQEPIMQNTPEYSEIESSTRHSGSVGPVRLGTLTSTGSHEFLSSMSSNPLYHPTDIRPLHMKPISSLPPASVGVLEVNAIYAEPQPPPSTHELEWDPDQNIYESIYSEPLNPSLFMQNSEPTDSTEELRPYMSIYTVPVVPTTDKPRSVSITNIKEIKHLGDGNFGQVVLAQTVGLTPKDLQLEGDASYTLVAVKKLKASASNRNRELFDKEVSFMSRLKHPNVIRLLGVCSEGETPFIMMEYMTNGDLNQYLQGFDSIGDETADSAKSVSTSTLVYMCTQISSAMQYLASQNFVHRDLATRNCLVGSKDTIKISDFGMSRSLYESQYYVISGHAILPIRWMATECFFGKFSAKTDVWAFGVTMWEIFTLAKERPYDHLEDHAVVEDAVRGAKRTLLNCPAQCPENMFEIMKNCWIHDASLRPTFDELHNLLSNVL